MCGNYSVWDRGTQGRGCHKREGSGLPSATERSSKKRRAVVEANTPSCSKWSPNLKNLTQRKLASHSHKNYYRCSWWVTVFHIVIQEPMCLLHCGSALLSFSPFIQMMGNGLQERGVYEPGLEGTHIASAHILLARTQSHGHVEVRNYSPAVRLGWKRTQIWGNLYKFLLQGLKLIL